MTWFPGNRAVLAKDHLRINEEIGHGQGGVVYTGILTTRLHALRPVAIKQLKQGIARETRKRRQVVYLLLCLQL